MDTPTYPGPAQAVPVGGQAVPELACSSMPRESEGAMKGHAHQQNVLITNPEGLHLRLAMAFATLAATFQSDVTVSLGARQANGKSLLDLITLVALPGSELTVKTTGTDSQAALDALVALVSKWSDIKDPENSLPQKG